MLEISDRQLVDLNTKNDVSQTLRLKLASYLQVEDLPLSHSRFVNGADAAIHALIHAFVKDKETQYYDLNYRYATKLIQRLSSSSIESKTSWNTKTGRRELDIPRHGTEACYLSSPDNRLGLDVDKMQITSFVTQYPNVLFIVDEAYRDFSPESSLVQLALSCPNLLLIRTFSKFFGIESSRIAYIIGNSNLLSALDNYIPQYPIATNAIKEALRSIQQIDVSAKLHDIDAQKHSFYAKLNQKNIDYSVSCTDFVTIFNPDENTETWLCRTAEQSKLFELNDIKCLRVKLTIQP